MQLIFLTGHRKSGTTLLHKLFDGHPELCVYPVDVSLLYAYFPAFPADPAMEDEALVERACTVVCQSLRQSGAGERPVDRQAFLSMFRERLKRADLHSRTEVLRTLLECWQAYSQADPSQPVVIKETSQAVYLSSYLAAFPEMKMINLLRDPRDNYAALKAGVGSYYSKLGESDKETLASLINRARLDFACGQANAELAPEVFRNVNFERLVEHPREVMEALAEFAGIAFDECMMSPTVMGSPFVGNSYDDIHFKGISDSNVGRWADRISPEEAKIIEFWMQTEMDWAGYPPVFPRTASQSAAAEFYDWYNTRYFFRDAFGREKAE